MPILVSNNFPPRRGGIQILMARIAECLHERGRDVVVVGPRESGSELYDATVPYRVLRYVARNRRVELLAIARTYVRALRVARERVTIASVWWPVAFALAFIPRALRGPLAILVHGNEVAPSRTGPRQWIMRAVFARADVVLANSAFTKGLLQRAGIVDNVRVIPLGVDMEPVVAARSTDATVLSVGRLVERKGFDRVIDALPALCAEFPALRYEIVGEGPERTALATRAERLGVAEHVRFLGSLTEDELRAAYARAWCFALPVRAVDEDVEGFGIVYLEAAMASLPTVGGLASGAADAIAEGETGLLVDGTDSAAISAAIGTLLRERETSAAMGERGLARAREYTWMRTTDAILAALPPMPNVRRT